MGVFKTYDIRGIYPDELDNKSAYLIGFYLCKYLKEDLVKVAHDKRNSYEELTKYLLKGILDSGSKVEYLGLSSTPNFYYSLYENNKPSTGVMVTASHNPKDFNGFKLMYRGDSFDSRNGLKELEEVFQIDEFNLSEKYEEIKEDLDNKSLIDFIIDNDLPYSSSLENYIDYLVEFYNNLLTAEETAVLNNIEFTTDFSSGVSSLSMGKFIEKVGLNSKTINHVIDGNFPSHSPEPSNAKDFIKSLENNSDFTVVFDGDGDRIAFFDENKNFVLVDNIIALLIDYFSEFEKNFACDLRISKSVKELSNEKDIEISVVRVGRVFFTEMMRENNYFFGGELSGHFFFKDFMYLDNPDIALIYMLKIIAKYIVENKVETFSFSSLVDKYNKYYKTDEINLEISQPDKFINKLSSFFSEKITSRLDGITFDFDTYWFNIRKSNTENLIRIVIEGEDKETVEKSLEEIKSFLE